jgi:16S rRNA (guanine(966)-N(2))-methyltransferase RsmD
MRIIGGSLKGRSIVPPAGFNARPTTDFAKEGLFNVLSNELVIEDISVLDLFSGTGSISYEFASRGCGNITAVEMNMMHYKFIKKNSAELKLGPIQVVRMNVFDFLNICKLKYDLIFADPPFNMDNFGQIPDKIVNSGILNDHGYLIIEHSGDFNFSGNPRFTKEKKYGNVHFSFFK